MKAGKPVLTGEIQELYEKAPKAIEERAKKIQSGKKGPSFAMRHPFVTGGAGLVAGKMIFGEKKPDAMPPAVQYPQNDPSAYGMGGYY